MNITRVWNDGVAGGLGLRAIWWSVARNNVDVGHIIGGE